MNNFGLIFETGVFIQAPTNKSYTSMAIYNCVFWDFNLNNGFGNWNTYGCILSVSKNSIYTCTCNHTTEFAILIVI